jgi:preprotein translocase subunit YajC
MNLPLGSPNSSLLWHNTPLSAPCDRISITINIIKGVLMDFLISAAYAQDAAAPQGPSGMANILLLVGMFVIFYFILIRPQQKRAKEHRNLISALKKGDEVVTSGGLLGKLTEVSDNFVTVQLAENVEIKVQRHAIASVMPKGTLKSAE